MKEKRLDFMLRLLILPLGFLVAIWCVYWLNWNYSLRLTRMGVYPREYSGLVGVVASPFLHSGIKHLYNNSIALFVLLLALRYFYTKQVWKVLFWGIILSGFGTWLIGRESYHIGASGLVYVLVSFIFFKGIQSKYYQLVALSLAVVVVYGGLFWYMFPEIQEDISWEGHLSGFITGIILAYFLEGPKYEEVYKYEWQKPDYDWSNDPFMMCFDENGNFAPLIKEKKLEKKPSYFHSNYPSMIYLLKENNDKET